MKNTRNIVLGALVAVIGSTAALGSAYALYSATPKSEEIHIGANTTSAVSLAVGSVALESEEAVVSPSADHQFSFNIGFDKNGTEYTQEVYLAKLSVVVESSNADLLDGLVSSESGFAVDADGTYYSAYWQKQTAAKFSKAEDGLIVASAFVPLVETQDLKTDVNLSLKNVTSDDFVQKIAEAQYNISIDLTEPDSSYQMAYVVGEDSGWGEMDKYMMFPNPKADDFEWAYKMTTGLLTDGKLFKCKVNTTYSPDPDWTYHENDHGNKYLRWTGGSDKNMDLADSLDSSVSGSTSN